MTLKPLTIAIDARVIPEHSGGIEQAVTGLAFGLSKLESNDERFLFLSYPGKSDWLSMYLKGNSAILYCEPPQPPKLRTRIGRHIPVLASSIHKLRQSLQPPKYLLPSSDGSIERAGVDLIHFTTQSAFCTGIPSIYHPHDLQHIHLPQFFAPEVRRRREMAYGHFCWQAAMVAVTSSWVKQDIAAHYQLPDKKIEVIPFAPPTQAYPAPSTSDLRKTRDRYRLPEAYAFYPAQTWPHKNHIGLLRATAQLRDQHKLTVPLVFSGKQNEYHPEIKREIRILNLEEQVQFLGFVTPIEIQSLYHLARCVIIPSKFEAASFPVWEAFLAGTACACSNVTSLPMQAGDAALVFDPNNDIEIANALARLWTDVDLRTRLIARGKVKIAVFSWEKTARLFRAHYRRLTIGSLTASDKQLLAEQPLL